MTDVVFITNAGGDGRVQYGGAERFLSELLPELTATFDVLCVVPPSRLADELLARGVRVIVAGPRRIVDFQFIRRVRNIVKNERPRLISLHLLSGAFHGRLATLGLPLRRQVTLHNNLWEIAVASSGWREVMHARRALLIDAVLSVLAPARYVAVSGEDAEILRKHHRDTSLIRNCLPRRWPAMQEFDRAAIRRSLGYSADTFLVGYLGRFERQKGVDLIWQAARLFPENWKLLVVGEGLLEPPQLPGIRNLGWQADPAPLLLAMDVVLMPSRWEVFGKCAIEALSMGCRLLHSGVGGLAALEPDARPLAVTLTDWSPASLRRSLMALCDLPLSPLLIQSVADDVRRKYSAMENTRAWGALIARTLSLAAAE